MPSQIVIIKKCWKLAIEEREDKLINKSDEYSIIGSLKHFIYIEKYEVHVHTCNLSQDGTISSSPNPSYRNQENRNNQLFVATNHT